MRKDWKQYIAIGVMVGLVVTVFYAVNLIIQLWKELGL